MISTPYAAYKWLRSIGLSHPDAEGIVASKAKFEYFVAALHAIR